MKTGFQLWPLEQAAFFRRISKTTCICTFLEKAIDKDILQLDPIISLKRAWS